MKNYFVYIMANEPFGTLYIGVTSNLIKRVWEHKNNKVPGFTKKYTIHMLVYYEVTESVQAALQREKNLKHWYRDWKIDLINQFNPKWQDLYTSICGEE